MSGLDDNKCWAMDEKKQQLHILAKTCAVVPLPSAVVVPRFHNNLALVRIHSHNQLLHLAAPVLAAAFEAWLAYSFRVLVGSLGSIAFRSRI